MARLFLLAAAAMTAPSFRLRASGAIRPLVTPEGVVLHLELASGGQRLWAFLLDLTMMAAALVALTIAGVVSLGVIGFARSEVVAVVWLLGFFVLRNLWFISFEGGRRAATPGKRLLGIRVASRDGGRLTTEAVVARNLLRELEFFLPLSFLFYKAGTGTGDALTALAGLGWSLVFLLFPLFNRDRLRIGDLVAGTWVLRTPVRRLGADLADRAAAVDHGFVFSEAQLEAYGEFELQTLEGVLRRANPNPMRRDADDPVVLVAATVRARIGATGGDDHAFLAAYYAALRARLERGLLFGRRRADKNDR